MPPNVLIHPTLRGGKDQVRIPRATCVGKIHTSVKHVSISPSLCGIPGRRKIYVALRPLCKMTAQTDDNTSRNVSANLSSNEASWLPGSVQW